MGFSAEMPVDRCYRDSRINRIFEGTNEINRLVVADMTLKFAKKAGSPLFDNGKKIFDECMNDSLKSASAQDYYTYYQELIINLKKAVLLVLGRAYESLGKVYSSEQEVMMSISDMIIQMYVAESMLMRVRKMGSLKGETLNSIYHDILDCFMYEASGRVYKYGMDAVTSISEGKEFEKLRAGLHVLTACKALNVKESRRRIADVLIEDNRYAF
jgi:hypothetical protein